MKNIFSVTTFEKRFPTDEACLDEIKKLRFPQGIHCIICNTITKHYKLRHRTAYSCEWCRNQVFPLKGTIFEKSTTPLRIWLFCMFLMTHTRGKLSVKRLQKELRVTYKTAWRMKKNILALMKQNRGDLLTEPERTITVSFFNAFELKVIQKQESS